MYDCDNHNLLSVSSLFFIYTAKKETTCQPLFSGVWSIYGHVTLWCVD